MALPNRNILNNTKGLLFADNSFLYRYRLV